MWLLKIDRKELNLDYEKKIVEFLGYRLGEPVASEGSQDIDVYSKKRHVALREYGMLHVRQLPDGHYMNQLYISEYGSNVYCCEWCLSTEHTFSFSVGKLECNYNPFEMPSSENPFVERLKIKNKDGDSLSLGFFDYTLNPSKKYKRDPLIEKITERGFYLSYKTKCENEKLIYSNMSDKPGHESSYIHLKNGKGISLPCCNDIETAAKNDVEGIEFFKKMRERLNELLPYEGDVLSFVISNEEIKKYGLSIYIEPKKSKKSGMNKSPQAK